MQFHIQEMMSKGLQTSINEQLDVSSLFQERRDVIQAGPLHVALTVTGYEQFVSAEGQLVIDYELACSRCLEPVKAHTVIPFSEQFIPALSRQEEGEEEDDDNDFIEIDSDRLDLVPYLEETLLLFMPFAPLCSKDCKGLCQSCGQNLNEGSCSCETDRIDPRFEALKNLFKE